MTVGLFYLLLAFRYVAGAPAVVASRTTALPPPYRIADPPPVTPRARKRHRWPDAFLPVALGALGLSTLALDVSITRAVRAVSGARGPSMIEVDASQPPVPERCAMYPRSTRFPMRKLWQALHITFFFPPDSRERKALAW